LVSYTVVNSIPTFSSGTFVASLGSRNICGIGLTD
jgi:hypothetical protein